MKKPKGNILRYTQQNLLSFYICRYLITAVSITFANQNDLPRKAPAVPFLTP